MFQTILTALLFVAFLAMTIYCRRTYAAIGNRAMARMFTVSGIIAGVPAAVLLLASIAILIFG